MVGSRMNSSDTDGGRRGGVGGSQLCILLSKKQFEAIRQVTYQLREYEENLLADRTASPGVVATLIEFVNSLKSLAEQAARVRIIADDSCGTNFISTSALRAGLSDLPGEWEAVGKLPGYLTDNWLSMMRDAVSLLGGRELFLRTGYDLDEVRDALVEFGSDRS